MVKVTANDSRIKSFFDAYHAKVKSRPDLYKNDSRYVTITLPADLLDYANASAGHSGFGAGARPVGIRRTVEDNNQAIDNIFSSVESLANFINSSECDAAEYIAAIRAGATPPTRKTVTAKEASANAEYRIAMNASQAIATIKAAVKAAKTRAETAKADADRTAMLKDFETMTSTDFAAKYQFTI